MEKEEFNKDREEDLANILAYKETKDLRTMTLFFQKYMSLIYGLSLKYLKDKERSKDAVMEVYEKLTDKLLKHEIQNPKSWLYTLVKNHCYEILRSEKRILEKESSAHLMYSDDVFHLNDIAEKEQDLVMLEECINSLEAMQKKCIRLFYLEKTTYKEICDNLEITWSKARSLIQNGRRNLKICMNKKYESIKEK